MKIYGMKMVRGRTLDTQLMIYPPVDVLGQLPPTWRAQGAPTLPVTMTELGHIVFGAIVANHRVFGSMRAARVPCVTCAKGPTCMCSCSYARNAYNRQPEQRRQVVNEVRPSCCSVYAA